MNLATCIARGCGVGIPSQRLMCRTHWYMVPAIIRRVIQSTYRLTSEPGRAAHQLAVEEAIRAVAELEGQVKILWSGQLGGDPGVESRGPGSEPASIEVEKTTKPGG